MTDCKECGSEVSDDALFCGNCGIAFTAFAPEKTERKVGSEKSSLDSVDTPSEKRGSADSSDSALKTASEILPSDQDDHPTITDTDFFVNDKDLLRTNPSVSSPIAESSDEVSLESRAHEKTSATSVNAKPQNRFGDPTSTEISDQNSFTTPNIAAADTDGKNRATLKTLQEGALLNGRYEIVKKIGGGGMGAVYLAHDRNLGGMVRAVKEMVQSHIEESQQEKAVEDFRRESLLLTTLDHPSIPTIYDYFFDERSERFYLVMKYISGGDLASRLRAAPEGRIDEKQVTDWAIQLASVLEYLHNHEPPIIYRDLKPSNVMIDGVTGRVMLVDFGIARWVNKDERGVTAIGTMGYAPPELFSGNVEPRSDIYSLGSTIFHLLTGADPQSNPLLIFNFEKNPRPRQINPQLTDQIEAILARAVEYDAHLRFASAAEFRAALAKHASDLKSGRVTFGIAIPQKSPSFESPVFCGFCGQKIVASDVFCPYCGVRQPSLAQAGAKRFVGRKTARLVVLNTNELESPQIVLEKDENLIGRRDPISNIFPEVDLSKFDPTTKVSRRHARIWRESGSFLIEDLGSSNGTFIVRKDTIKLHPRQPCALANGDKVRLGDTTLHFVLN